MLKKLKKTASFYIFNTPYNSALFLNFLKDKAIFQNFITWYKKDGMSASKKRFNNNQESILFFTMSKNYYFDCESIRIPYLSTDRMAHAAKKGILKNGKRWYPNPNGKLCPDVWEISSARHTNKINGKVVKQNHPTPKPKEMIERMIKASSKEHDLILDLFAGSCITSLCAQELNRIFTTNEIDYANSYNEPESHLAGIWATKEAFIKAVKNKAIPLKDIEILHDENHAPYINITPRLESFIMDKNYSNVDVSISHTKDDVVSVVQIL